MRHGLNPYATAARITSTGMTHHHKGSSLRCHASNTTLHRPIKPPPAQYATAVVAQQPLPTNHNTNPQQLPLLLLARLPRLALPQSHSSAGMNWRSPCILSCTRRDSPCGRCCCKAASCIAIAAEACFPALPLPSWLQVLLRKLHCHDRSCTAAAAALVC